MKRVLIIGNNGSGKSVFSRRLGEKLRIPVIHLDKYYHLANWKTVAKDDWDKMQYEFIKGEKWIIDGTYMRTLETRLKAADTIIFLDLPKWLAITRAIKRRIINRNKYRPDMPEFLSERMSPSLFRKMLLFSKKKLL